jgi:hypothetical protein
MRSGSQQSAPSRLPPYHKICAASPAPYAVKSDSAMLHLSSVVTINSLVWISSLDPGEKGTTDRVHDDLQPYFVSIGLPFIPVEPRSANELLAGLDAIARSGLPLPLDRMCTAIRSPLAKISIVRPGHVAAWVLRGLIQSQEPTFITSHCYVACCSTLIGSVKEKVEPCPSADSTQIFPPCSSIIRFDMASPSPVPPFLRVIELSAC